MGVRPRAARLDAALAAAFGLAGLATRWAVRSHGLVSFDAGLLASGIREFDFRNEWPHPPYYPLTIAAGKVLALWMAPWDALVLLSVLASGVMCALSYLLGARFADRWTGAAASTLLLLSPVALVNGAVALSYGLEGAASAAVGLVAWEARRRGGPRWGAILGVTLSVAIGIRPSSLFFLAPLALWATWRERRALAGTAAAGAIATTAWVVPMLAAGGGLHEFLLYNAYQSRNVVFVRTAFTGGWPIVALHAAHLAAFVSREAPFLAATAALALVGAFGWARGLPGRVATFLLAWALPALAFYVVVYAGWPVYPPGYVLVLAPPVALACAVVLVRLARFLAAGAPAGLPRAVQAIGLAVVLSVAAVPLAWPAQWRPALHDVREVDGFERDWRGAEQAFPPNSTALLTFIEWHWARLEHPDYIVWGARPYWNATGRVLVQVAQGQHGAVDRPTAADMLDGPLDPPHPIPPGIRLVLLPEGTAMLKPTIAVHDETLPSGRVVQAFNTTGLSSIEQALRWFDDGGRLDPSTLDPNDERGVDVAG